MNNLVSVLLPCFNHSKFVEECLQSVIDSDYPSLEIIFIDDGSTDDSFELANRILTRHPDRFHRVICKKQQNQGVCKTLNKMIIEAQGKWVTLLATDDKLTTDGISNRVSYLERSSKKAVIGKCYIFNEKSFVTSNNAGKTLYGASTRLLNSQRINRELTLRWSVVGPSLLLEKECYSLVGMYNEDLQVEDRDFYLRLIANNIIGFTDHHVAYYRLHSGNTSRQKYLRSRKSLLDEIARTQYKYSKQWKPFTERLTLASYRIDSFLLTKNAFLSLTLFKAARKMIVSLILCLTIPRKGKQQ